MEVKKRGRPRKTDVIIDDHANDEICYECNGARVIPGGFKYWKTCPTCRGDKWIPRRSN
jgi:hypothetical protein